MLAEPVLSVDNLINDQNLNNKMLSANKSYPKMYLHKRKVNLIHFKPIYTPFKLVNTPVKLTSEPKRSRFLLELSMSAESLITGRLNTKQYIVGE